MSSTSNGFWVRFKTKSISSAFTERWLFLLAAIGNSSVCKGKKSESERLGPEDRQNTDVGIQHTVPHACFWLAAYHCKSQLTSPGLSFYFWKMSHSVSFPQEDLCSSCEMMWVAYLAQWGPHSKCSITGADMILPMHQACDAWKLDKELPEGRAMSFPHESWCPAEHLAHSTRLTKYLWNCQ